MTKAGSILILIISIFESFFIFPLIWTIPCFILFNKVNQEKSTEGQKIALAILGIIFGLVLGLIGGILILVDLKNNDNLNSKHNKDHIINQDDIKTR